MITTRSTPLQLPLRALRAPAAALLLALLATATPAQDNDTCLTCHGDASMFEGMENAAALTVSGEAFAASIHGELELECVACHQSLAGVEDFPHDSPLPGPVCADCHPDAAAEYQGSIHGYALQHAGEHPERQRHAPTCASCHGSHDIRPSSEPDSRTYKQRLPETCGQCHGRAGLRTGTFVKLAQVVDTYAHSVHGQRTAAGELEAASCTDCHGVHDLRGKADPASRMNPQHVAETCGQCHADIRQDYDESIHGMALAAGIGDSPTCTGCHGEHLILSPEGEEARTHARNLATQVCGGCHNDPVIIEKYGLRSGVVGSYVDSYHGWATRRDSAQAASCVDCHGDHRVLPASDPESTISPERVTETCGRCHQGATASFAASYDHLSTSIQDNPINRVIRAVYIVAIVLIIGGMLVHNLVILGWYMIQRRRREEQGIQVTRMSASEIAQHALLAVSFTGLVITGFALRFPEAWWVQELTGWGMDEPLRQDLHRAFGVVLMGLAAYHVAWALLTRRGRSALRDILPAPGDAGEAIANMRYYLGGNGGHRPRFGRYDYTQKAEYWALVWGTGLMALTGLVLWFPELAVRVFPSWMVAASQTVHYYEAWLATLAILVWHFFFEVFHPDAYPMSWTWITGRMSEDRARHHHPRWAEKELTGGSARGGSETA